MTAMNLTNIAFLAINVTILVLVFLVYRTLAALAKSWVGWAEYLWTKETSVPCWEYTSRLDFGALDTRALEWQHLSDKGWELVSVNINPETGGTQSIFKRRRNAQVPFAPWRPNLMKV